MSAKTGHAPITYQLCPIGRVQRNKNEISLEIDSPFRPGLLALEHFSHVIVCWWADRLDSPQDRELLQMKPPYAEEHLTGVFASRSPARPNPIAVTTCELLGVDHTRGVVRIANIDAVAGSPVVDLKAYFPVCDRVQNAHIPEWLTGWPEWMPAEGIGLEEWER